MSETVPWRYAACNEMFEGWSLEKTANCVAELGYQGLELAPFTLCEQVTDLLAEDRKTIRQTVEGAGLEVAGLHWLLANTPFRLNPPDPEERKKAAAYLLDLVDFCADVGGKILVFGSPAQRDPVDGFSLEEGWAAMVKAMRACGERASERGVTFCIEPLGTAFVSWVDDAIRMVQEVDCPGFQMMVDCKAMAKDERWSVGDQIRHANPWFKHVHVNDPNRLGPGMGELDFVPIMAALKEVEFGGWVSLEAFEFSLGTERIARESMANLQAAIARSM
ncbi:MAG: sugar phosphate isomerase/epimerase [bacterium]|nr:sugar phosphate isomerase/epimerase [bacterium]